MQQVRIQVTRRQYQILRLIAAGHSHQEIQALTGLCDAVRKCKDRLKRKGLLKLQGGRLVLAVPLECVSAGAKAPKLKKPCRLRFSRREADRLVRGHRERLAALAW